MLHLSGVYGIYVVTDPSALITTSLLTLEIPSKARGTILTPTHKMAKGTCTMEVGGAMRCAFFCSAFALERGVETQGVTYAHNKRAVTLAPNSRPHNKPIRYRIPLWPHGTNAISIKKRSVSKAQCRRGCGGDQRSSPLAERPACDEDSNPKRHRQHTTPA